MKRKTIFAAIFMVIIFITMNCIAQTEHRSFTLTVDGKDVAVNLPKEVPDMKDALYIGERCFDAHLCVGHYNINEEETLVISFWNHKGEVIGFVLHDMTQDIAKHTPWFYANDIPTLTTVEGFSAKLTELYQGG